MIKKMEKKMRDQVIVLSEKEVIFLVKDLESKVEKYKEDLISTIEEYKKIKAKQMIFRDADTYIELENKIDLLRNKKIAYTTIHQQCKIKVA
jgi:hypothetical protein